MDGNNAFGEDMLQMALKMATEYEDQPVDLESAMTANTITPSSHPGMPGEFRWKAFTMSYILNIYVKQETDWLIYQHTA